MKISRKILVVIALLLMSSLVLFGCGGAKESTPADDFSNLMTAFQDQDYAKVQELLGEEASEEFDIESMKEAFASGFGEESSEASRQLVDDMFQKMSDFTYDVKEEKIDGEKATLQVEMTYNDVATSLEEGMMDVLAKTMESFDPNMSDADMEKMIIDSLSVYMNENTKTVTESVPVEMLKDAEAKMWRINQEGNDALLNAVFGNLQNLDA